MWVLAADSVFCSLSPRGWCGTVWVWSSFGPIQLKTLRPRESTEREICPVWGGATQCAPPATVCEAGQMGPCWWLLPPFVLSFTSVNISAYQPCWPSLKRREGERLDPDRDTDSGATVQPGGRNWEKQRQWQLSSVGKYIISTESGSQELFFKANFPIISPIQSL